MSSKTKTPTHVAECHGVKVPDSPMMNPERIARINGARYEGQEIAGALKVIKPDDHVLEMGAGIGLVGAIAAKKGKPKKVMSFEANPNLIDHIRKLYTMNRLGKKIELRNEVLISAPNAPKTLPFHIRNSYLGSSLVESETRPTTRVDVPVASYKKVHSQFKPTVLLMDIEGGELEFLRHASLEGIRSIVIEFHPEAYGIKGMRECKGILRNADFVKVEGACTRTVWTCEHKPILAAPHVDRGWSREIEVLDNATVIPPTVSAFEQPAGVLRADGSYCPGGALWRNGRPLTVEPAPVDAELPVRKGTWLWGSVLWQHFGHFLVESTSRLWALDHIKENIDGILFIPKRPSVGSDVSTFQQSFADLLGADVPVVCAAEPERVERLIVPGQGFGLGQMISGTDEFRATIANRFAKNIAPEGSEKLYISRSQIPSGRGNLIGEAELEAHLVKEGYTVYHPEKHDLNHQIATYKAARKIIAAEGSALHLLAMVADPDMEVAIVVRRLSGATRTLERHLLDFAKVKTATINHVMRSWKPRPDAKPRLWMGELDMPLLQADLVKAGFISKSKNAWANLKTDDVRGRLGKGFEIVT